MLVLASRGGSKIPYPAASSHFAEALSTLREKSKTAKEIIDFVEKSPAATIQVLVTDIDGAFGPYNPEWAFLGPCIIWNPGGFFKTRGANITGYRPTGAPMFSGSKSETTYPPEITLIHEIGHAKQYIENPDWFGSRGPTGDVAGSKEVKEIEADNLRRHEHPVCKDYGLPQRINYQDFIAFDHKEVAIVRAVGR